MIKRTYKIIISGLILCSLAANAQETTNTAQQLNIPYKLSSPISQSGITVDDNKITIIAPKGTDLYTNSDGSYSNNNAPRIYFEPKSDFTFSSKVTADFSKKYDGGALFIYADENNWGKLLFERFKDGTNGIASTVTRQVGDDAYHYKIENNEVHLKVIRKNNSFTFMYSTDGSQWSYLRSFSLKSQTPIKVGFLTQSPVSETHKVVYSDIQFEE